MATYGERLVELREEKGYNRKQLAEILGIPDTTLRNYEKNDREPGHKFLRQVAMFFNVSVDYILGLKDEKEVLKSIQLNRQDLEHIEKYKKIDNLGKEAVDYVLNHEFKRSRQIADLKEQAGRKEEKVVPLKAAHARTDIDIPEGADTSDDDIMKNENF